MPKSKNGLFFLIFALGYLGWKLFNAGVLDTYIYNTCSIEYANIKVEQMLDPSTKNKKLQDANAKMDRLLANSEIPADQKLAAKKDMLRYSWFIKNKQCPMPDTVESAFFHWTLPSDQSGVKDCPDDFYLKEAEAGVDLIYSYDKDAEEIEKEMLNTILQSAGENVVAKELINKKWERPEFRQFVLIAALQVLEREKQGCRYPDKPLQSVVREITKDYR